MTIRLTGCLFLSCLGLAACAGTGPGSATANSPAQAPSGITASNGGGQRALGNVPSVGVTNGTPTTTAVPNSKGASY